MDKTYISSLFLWLRILFTFTLSLIFSDSPDDILADEVEISDFLIECDDVDCLVPTDAEDCN